MIFLKVFKSFPNFSGQPKCQPRALGLRGIAVKHLPESRSNAEKVAPGACVTPI